MFNDLKARGCQDILVAVVDGQKVLAEAIHTVYPRTTVQICIVHLIRNVLNKSVRRAFDWKSAMNQFANLYGDRFALVKGWSEQWNF